MLSLLERKAISLETVHFQFAGAESIPPSQKNTTESKDWHSEGTYDEAIEFMKTKFHYYEDLDKSEASMIFCG